MVEEIFEAGTACRDCEYQLTWTEPRGEYGNGSVYEASRWPSPKSTQPVMASSGRVELCPGLRTTAGSHRPHAGQNGTP